MTGYSINDTSQFVALVAFVSMIPIVGYFLSMISRISITRTASWSFVVGSVLSVERMSIGEPSGTRMLLIVVALLWSMKSVVYVESRFRGKCVLTFWQWLGFCVGWFGMRAEVFNDFPSKPLSEWKAFVGRGLVRAVIGGAMIGAAWIIAHRASTGAGEVQYLDKWIATALLLFGLSLVVHFGFFNILTGVWRYLGARCTALFRAPLYSSSLSEFWSRRWNLAFSEMTALAVVRPLKQLPGDAKRVAGFATVVGFVFSGLLHELAISVPVGAGFGLPTLYFLIHGLAVVAEKRLPGLHSVLAGRVWTVAWVVLPLPILFHRPFLEGCVWPLIGV